MSGKRGSILDWLGDRRAERLWRARAASAPRAPLAELRGTRARARRLRTQIDRFLAVAENRLALPLIGGATFPAPGDADWSWRPALWQGPLPQPGIAAAPTKSTMGDEVTLFHDCRLSELTLRQLRNRSAADLAPYGLRMDVFRFDGSYLSLALDLPEAAARGLTQKHLVRLDCIVEMEKPLEIFARLNIRHGPNTEQIVRELPLAEARIMVEFDLAYAKLHERRIEKLWLDLIFDGPEMNQVAIRDLTMSRRKRAEF